VNEFGYKLKMRLPAIVLLAASLIFWGLYDRWESAGPELLRAPGLADAARVSGDCTAIDGVFKLVVPDGGTVARIDFPLKDATEYEHIRISGRIKATDVVQGQYRWSCARYLLLQYDAQGKWIPGRHSLLKEVRTTDWKFKCAVFNTDPTAAHVYVVLEQRGRSGTAEFDQIQVEPVQLRASYKWWWSLSIISWLGMGLLYYRRCRLHERRLRTLITLNVIAILVGTLISGAWIENLLQDTKKSAKEAWVENRPPDDFSVAPQQKDTKQGAYSGRSIDWAVSQVHRMGHFALFASLCFLVYCSAALERQHPVYFIKVAFDILLFAGITESLQFLTLDRTAGFADFMTDVYGMVLAFLLFLCIRPMIRRHLEQQDAKGL
jgi:hypothetical protein